MGKDILRFLYLLANSDHDYVLNSVPFCRPTENQTVLNILSANNGDFPSVERSSREPRMADAPTMTAMTIIPFGNSLAGFRVLINVRRDFSAADRKD